MGKFVISSDGTNYIPNDTDEGNKLYSKRYRRRMEERYYVKIGNCYVAFLGIWHEPMMKDDYHKATPFITEAGAREEAKRRCTKPFKIVKKSFVK